MREAGRLPTAPLLLEVFLPPTPFPDRLRVDLKSEARRALPGEPGGAGEAGLGEPAAGVGVVEEFEEGAREFVFVGGVEEAGRAAGDLRDRGRARRRPRTSAFLRTRVARRAA